MDVTNLLDIRTREELYRWYQENHDKVSGFWLRVNRAAADCPGVVRYIDAVEVALCFGWIDSTLKSIDDGKPVQHFTPRRKRSNWCERNLIRCRRLVKIGDMTPAGLAVASGWISFSTTGSQTGKKRPKRPFESSSGAVTMPKCFLAGMI